MGETSTNPQLSATPTQLDSQQIFVNTILSELDLYREKLLRNVNFTGIYIGGGTPTSLEPSALNNLLKGLILRTGSDLTEFTIESSPDTLLDDKGRERLKILRENGIDRLSIGIQSLDDRILKQENRYSKNRGYSSEQAQQIIKKALEYFNHVNLDFIYGFQNQAIDSVISDLQLATKLGVQSITTYPLRPHQKDRYPNESVDGRKFRKMPNDFPDEDKVLKTRSKITEFLENRSYHQKINNWFTLGDIVHKAQEQRWKDRIDRIGIGPSAYSDTKNFVWKNYPTKRFEPMEQWASRVKASELPIATHHQINPEENLRKDIVYGIKIAEGVDFNHLNKKYEINFLEKFKKETGLLQKYGLINIEDNRLKLSKTGTLLAETVTKAFYSDECKRTMGYTI